MNVHTTPNAPAKPDLVSPAFFADRNATYRTLRDNFPFFYTDIDGQSCLVLTRYAHVDEALRHPLVTVHPEPGKFPEERIGRGSASRFYRESLVNLDAPHHTRIRRMLTPAFTSRAIGKMRAWMEEMVDDHLAMIENQSEVEFVTEFASPMATALACKLAHVPLSDAAELIPKVHDLIAILGVSSMASGALEAADAAGDSYYAYMDNLFETLKERGLPADDPAGVLLAAEGREDVPRSELVTLLAGYIIATYHTSKGNIINAALQLLLHPEQKARLVEHPELAASAWEEVLRYDGPVHFMHRYTSAPITIDGVPIEAGQRLLLGLHAANRDERRFPDPDSFIIDRPNNRHFGFAGGAHFCIGAQVARLEGEVLLQRLFQRFPAMRIKEEWHSPVQDLSFPMVERLVLSLR